MMWVVDYTSPVPSAVCLHNPLFTEITTHLSTPELQLVLLRASAMLKHVIDIGWTSVRLSVTRWHPIKTAERLVMISSPHDSPFILVFCVERSSRNSNGVTPYGAAKQRWGLKIWQFSTNNSIYFRNDWRQMGTCSEAFDKHWILFRSV